jgi:hypothetical protein
VLLTQYSLLPAFSMYAVFTDTRRSFVRIQMQCVLAGLLNEIGGYPPGGGPSSEIRLVSEPGFN